MGGLNNKASTELTSILRNAIAKELRGALHKFLEKQHEEMNKLVKIYTEQLRIDIEDKLLMDGIKPMIEIHITHPQIVIEEDKTKDAFEVNDEKR